MPLLHLAHLHADVVHNIPFSEFSLVEDCRHFWMSQLTGFSEGWFKDNGLVTTEHTT
jgi:hypothetical protein